MVELLNKRCESSGCQSLYEYSERPYAAHNIDGTRLCGSCLRSLHPEISKYVKLRKEHFCLAEIQNRIPELHEHPHVWDCPIGCTLQRPDLFYFLGNIGIHIEIDEHGDVHEDSDTRLARIHEASGMEGTYVIRINPDAYVDDNSDEFGPCFVRRLLSNGEPVLKVTPEFKRRFDFIEPVVRAVYEKAAAGELPTEDSWKTKLFFSE